MNPAGVGLVRPSGENQEGGCWRGRRGAQPLPSLRVCPPPEAFGAQPWRLAFLGEQPSAPCLLSLELTQVRVVPSFASILPSA